MPGARTEDNASDSMGYSPCLSAPFSPSAVISPGLGLLGKPRVHIFFMAVAGIAPKLFPVSETYVCKIGGREGYVLFGASHFSPSPILKVRQLLVVLAPPCV